MEIEYLKCQNYETEIEIFWIDIKNIILKNSTDSTEISFKLNRSFVGAVSGEFAGILIEVLLSLPESTIATLSVWKKIKEHFKLNREKKRLPRILSLKILDNLCRYELYENGFKSFSLIKSKKLIQNDEKGDFSYVDDAEKCNVAKFTYETKKLRFKFIIDNDGEITKFTTKKINNK